ncbi:MAG: thioredoxin [Candidatus Marinimicrobia bacterium]|mgnify:FL=1|jgi:thioredoxin 1|nr:thioredoxin [Candidatus Neomarinimicrobiota bacterium]MBT3617834.1 thioredoxin [Candidatus Neomarinimicrobiota bacterium]MBT3828191.1 thioredoxin [Candidatus Neomarinimicrobiota bacterium]MBT3997108.1 thioredoxin [Candidatus Neomarinimicrobiota bacterium]MBT4280574.1 thioredoxin [Candidatus Neomarinimicrobiota bacterium]
MADNVAELKKDNFDVEVVQSEVPVLVDFWAEWCGPCKAIAPVVEEIATEYEGKVKVGKVNVDENQELSLQFGVRSIPTLLIFKDGKVANQVIGAVPKTNITQLLDQSI